MLQNVFDKMLTSLASRLHNVQMFCICVCVRFSPFFSERESRRTKHRVCKYADLLCYALVHYETKLSLSTAEHSKYGCVQCNPTLKHDTFTCWDGLEPSNKRCMWHRQVICVLKKRHQLNFARQKSNSEMDEGVEEIERERNGGKRRCI